MSDLEKEAQGEFQIKDYQSALNDLENALKMAFVEGYKNGYHAGYEEGLEAE
jgi:flagellar biosynthesis/type III secretory pathway protein FliH